MNQATESILLAVLFCKFMLDMCPSSTLIFSLIMAYLTCIGTTLVLMLINSN